MTQQYNPKETPLENFARGIKEEKNRIIEIIKEWAKGYDGADVLIKRIEEGK